MSGSSQGEWILAGIIFVVGSIVAYNVIDPFSDKHEKQAAAEFDQRMKWQQAEARLAASRNEGAEALEQADNAIRREASDRRSRLERASSSVKTTNRNGVRVDQYILKRGGIISCTTTISGNSPAMFICDGDV